MINTASGWELEVERGPDWLIVQVVGPCTRSGESISLEEALWSLLEQHFTHRLVVEMDRIEVLDEELIDQLTALHDRICDRGGLMRLCGVKPDHRRLLARRDVDDRLLVYGDREHAVLGGSIPHRPR
jgi:anti-anti-sigma regulatory factor